MITGELLNFGIRLYHHLFGMSPYECQRSSELTQLPLVPEAEAGMHHLIKIYIDIGSCLNTDSQWRFSEGNVIVLGFPSLKKSEYIDRLFVYPPWPPTWTHSRKATSASATRFFFELSNVSGFCQCLVFCGKIGTSAAAKMYGAEAFKWVCFVTTCSSHASQ